MTRSLVIVVFITGLVGIAPAAEATQKGVGRPSVKKQLKDLRQGVRERLLRGESPHEFLKTAKLATHLTKSERRYVTRLGLHARFLDFGRRSLRGSLKVGAMTVAGATVVPLIIYGRLLSLPDWAMVLVGGAAGGLFASAAGYAVESDLEKIHLPRSLIDRVLPSR